MGVSEKGGRRIREEPTQSSDPSAGGAGIVDHPDPDARELDRAPLGKDPPELAAVHVAADRVNRRAEGFEVGQHRAFGEVAEMDDPIGCA